MKVRSHVSLEEELKIVLGNPHTSSNLEQAVEIAEQIIKIDEKSNYANYTMGLHELALSNRSAPMADYTKPIEVFKKIIRIDPNFVEAYLMLAKIYREVDRNEEYKLLLKANEQFPDHYLIMFDLANLMTFKTGEKEKGLELFGKCVQKLPMVDTAWSGLGTAYLMTRQFDMAMKSFETSLAINPDNITSILGIGVIHFENANFEEARKYYEKSLKLDKASFWGNFNLALLTLIQGDDEKGWEYFEKRDKEQYLKKYGGEHIPEIKKSEINENSGKNIVVMREQGFGDDVMFSRYLKKLLELGYDVTFACSPELKSFFKLFPDLDKIKITSSISVDTYFDYRVFLMSLPWVLSKYQKERIKRPLQIDLERLKKSKIDLPKTLETKINSKKLKVGIAWSGNPKHARDYCRSIKLELLGDIFKNSNVDFYVLQKVYNKDDAKNLKKFKNVYNLTDHLNNFMDTAHLIEKMDIIFTIDTSLLHVAGTMNKKTYLFLPKVPDYRWGLKETQDWYPSVNLLKQKEVDDWNYPLEKCDKIIKDTLSSSS